MHVQVSFGSRVTGVQLPSKAGDALLVSTEAASSSKHGSHGSTAGAEQSQQATYRCQLVVGADGASSKVRRALQARDGGWDMHVLPSDAGKLSWKVCCAHCAAMRSRLH